MKKIILLFSFLLILVSCGGKSSDGLVYHNGNGFSLKVPEKWEVFKDDGSILPRPNTGVIELASSSKVLKDGLANSLSVVSEDISQKVDSSQYSVISNLSQKGEYKTYKEVSKKQIQLGEKDSTTIFVFDAQYNLDTPKAKFLQAGVTCGKKGYILTLVIPESVRDTLKYEYIFSSFRCK